MKILQIVPTIGPGTGVGAVAHHLEAEWQRLGVPTARFTLDDAAGSWLPEPGPGARGKLVLALRVVWFSTVGTVLARRALRRDPAAVGVCHNDALAGDVYVNHGILQVAMRSRGRFALRMARNPMHLFIATRDTLRYSGRSHRLVVNLVHEEDAALRATYPRLRPPTVVLGNGVDIERYAPPTAAQRTTARQALGLPEPATVLAFVGHEFARKGLPLVVDALERLDEHTHLVVAGGTQDMVRGLRSDVRARGLADRVHLLGSTPDPRPVLHAADALVLPSAYESYGLVVLEALACGVPVVATPVGCVPDVVVDGASGYVVAADAEEIATAVRDLAARDRTLLAAASRAAAEQHSWEAVARRYVEVLRDLEESPTGRRVTL
ncbi:glycosyltransferase family 4 protein [Cellulosimicrobium arenosum]|uniref:Glycosyltransferase family 4 protein n=1 Tax=Cellulosimicrobium arenosum TaxID=2708133 RepID=A0A927G9C2_9MICO|nr:glycosyltransferase family 4 protein [Cellulosimicrobium arenosum]MBD8078964.1 glycosyltransferase family 4 protein [Cellulosimicrobium arenosum]